MARFELIVFDWDGTLMDSTGFIAACIQAAAGDLGLIVPSDDAARYIIGLGMQDAMRHAVPDLPPERFGEMAERYRHHFVGQMTGLPLFAGAADLVRELNTNQHLLAVATGKGRSGLTQAFDASGIGAYFHGSRCADECFSKPHPQMLMELMDEFGVDAASTLMIGDTTHDMRMAHNAGVAGLAVSYGAHSRELLLTEAPLHCVDSVDELAAWLRVSG
jgi:phosphoglycolate phosphatase